MPENRTLAERLLTYGHDCEFFRDLPGYEEEPCRHCLAKAALDLDRPIRFADSEAAMASALRIMERNAEALRLMADADDQRFTTEEFRAALQWVIDTDDEALRLLADH